jgi:hypothetical protein
MNVTTGIPQGSCISPVLFLFFNADLLDICSQPAGRLSAIGFVDDVNILTYGDSTEENCRKLERVHVQCADWARKHGAAFALGKYELLHLTRLPWHFNIYMEAPVHIGQRTIEPKAAIRILGAQIDSKLSWRPHIQKVQEKMVKQTKALTKLTTSTWGASFARARHIYITIVRPAITYASPVWFSPHESKHHNRSIVKKLNGGEDRTEIFSVQSKGARLRFARVLVWVVQADG